MEFYLLPSLPPQKKGQPKSNDRIHKNGKPWQALKAWSKSMCSSLPCNGEKITQCPAPMDLPWPVKTTTCPSCRELSSQHWLRGAGKYGSSCLTGKDGEDSEQVSLYNLRLTIISWPTEKIWRNAILDLDKVPLHCIIRKRLYLDPEVTAACSLNSTTQSNPSCSNSINTRIHGTQGNCAKTF